MFQWYMFKFEIFKLFSKNKMYDINHIFMIEPTGFVSRWCMRYTVFPPEYLKAGVANF